VRAAAGALALHLRVRLLRPAGLHHRQHLGAQGALAHGQEAGRQDQARLADHDIDVVIPVPDTSRTAALQLANQLGVPYAEGFIKNRYIGRTFIMPGQQVRKKSVRQKLNAIDLEFRKKNVLLVDDSIVRGTTSQQIIQMAAMPAPSGSTSPPRRRRCAIPNVYGIDMPAASELIAHGRTEAEIEAGARRDRLFFPGSR
jgi:amidophosphoribosyltransferase